MLLALVYGVFLVLIAAMASALAVIVGAHFSSAMQGTTVAHDRALIGLWADSNVTADELRGAGIDENRRAELDHQLASLARRSGMLHIEIRDQAGNLLLSDRPGLVGTSAPASDGYQRATAGEAAARLFGPGETAETAVAFDGPVIQEFLPLVEANGQLAAVVGIWRDATPFITLLDTTRRDILIVTFVAAAVLAAVLMVVFRSAHQRLVRQSSALFETTRRDPLTGLLNHGAAVAVLAERVDLAREVGAPLAVALIDVDNFRLLNETHGHAAGDAVLLAVAEQVGRATPSGTLVGRYGPDEFVIVGPPMAVEVVDKALEQLRQALRDVAMRFGDSEALPVTISAGVAAYPEAAKAVTELLAVAAAALGEAKVSGGDAVRRAGASGDQPAQLGTFNVLQGLVFAVDTKDRYTKRHSEDVARYAVFLGHQIGLPQDRIELLRVAGLLHDVGKVAIPDAVLRKPGALTPEERQVMQQHVALGDLIVRDLPEIDVVRAGVRHHHERWDGAGYLDGLAEEDIPLIARILAVGDAFSAMTTSRPYRKAVSVSEALKRLGDAAGTQLDERLVSAFVSAMETASDAPLPTDDAHRVRLWLPGEASGRA